MKLSDVSVQCRRIMNGEFAYLDCAETWEIHTKLGRAHIALKVDPLPPNILAMQSRVFHNCYHITFVQPLINHYCWLWFGKQFPFEPPELYTCYLFDISLPCRNHIDADGRIGKDVIGTWDPNMTIVDFLVGMQQLLNDRNAAVCM